MKKVAISGNLRTEIGTKNAKSLRRNEQVPCVLYGSGEAIHFSVDEKALNKVVFTPEAYRIELDLGGTKHQAMLQETQFHPLSDKVLHADFLTMPENKKAKVTLNLQLVGQAKGVRAGGKLSVSLRKLRVEGLPADLTEHLEYDVTEVDFGQSIRIKDLQFPKLQVLHGPDEVVVKITAVKKEATSATAESPASAGAEAAEEAPKEEAKD